MQPGVHFLTYMSTETKTLKVSTDPHPHLLGQTMLQYSFLLLVQGTLASTLASKLTRAKNCRLGVVAHAQITYKAH